jgi:ATP synthase subunit 6
MFSLLSPLEQFEIIPLIPFGFGVFDFSITNSSFFIIFILAVFIIFVHLLSVKGLGFIVPNRWQLLLENFYKFTLNITLENMGKKGQIYFPFIFCLFIFLIISNSLGLIPYSFTVTSHLVVTFALSCIVWFGKLIVGIQNHGIKLLGILLPSGIPFAMVPFFVIVEFLSFLIPLVALGVRLFANIIAGHILLKVIVGFCWSIIVAGGSIIFAHFIPMMVLFLLLFLETAVAFIQAYVFTMLSCLITGDIIRGGHLFFLL